MEKQLLNGCYRSKFTIYPKNWDSKSARVEKSLLKERWGIYYRFYDPTQKGTKLWGKQIAIRDMNSIKDLKGRQEKTRELLALEAELIDKKSFNPISGEFMTDQSVGVITGKSKITPETPYIEALTFALNQLQVETNTKIDIRSSLKYFAMSAASLKLDAVPIKCITPLELKHILDNCANLTILKKDKKTKKLVKVKKTWNANQFRHTKKNIGILYSAIKMYQAVPINPTKLVDNITDDHVDEEENVRTVLSPKERELLAELELNQPDFFRVINIFFHSGSRFTEMCRLKGDKVNLVDQKFKVLCKKRKNWVWVTKTIKDVALPFWIEQMKNCGPDDYVFSRGLKPGAIPIRPEQFTRRWKRHLKDKKGIAADFYSLKHLHTTETRDFLEAENEVVQKIAEHNSHTSDAMVVNIYDVKRHERRHSALKSINNPLIPQKVEAS